MILKFLVTLRKGEKIEKKEVSVESSDGTVSNNKFRNLLPDEFDDWEIVDFSKK